MQIMVSAFVKCYSSKRVMADIHVAWLRRKLECAMCKYLHKVEPFIQEYEEGGFILTTFADCQRRATGRSCWWSLNLVEKDVVFEYLRITWPWQQCSLVDDNLPEINSESQKFKLVIFLCVWPSLSPLSCCALLLSGEFIHVFNNNTFIY